MLQRSRCLFLRPRERARLTRLVVAVGAAAAVLAVSAVALARPGGGQSFGGSGGGGSGGGGGGDFSGFFDLIVLVFEEPEIGIPLLLLFGIVGIVRMSLAARERDWDAKAPAAPQQPQRRVVQARQALEQLRADDPDFSVVVFEDFLQTFWAEVVVKTANGRLDELAPWIAAPAAPALPRILGAFAVSSPIVGALEYGAVRFDATTISVDLTVEGMFSAHLSEGVQSYWVRDQLRLVRARQARSRAPGSANLQLCPSCGAPATNARTGRCEYCQQVVNDGRFDWVLAAVQRVATERRPPQLVTHAVEQGNELPTVRALDLAQGLAALRASDPGFSDQAFVQRLGVVFEEIQQGWQALDLGRIRPWVTDRQLESMRFWIEAYRAAGLRNMSRGRIVRTELARVTRDRWFDAVTVRVFATGLDYTVDARGAVVSGDAQTDRAYTEYWTLIRGTAARGVARSDRACPNCGAPLAIDMAGSCTHCRAHVVAGEFDWVLSRIEQDEVYAG